jgi:hypothetical protein
MSIMGLLLFLLATSNFANAFNCTRNSSYTVNFFSSYLLKLINFIIGFIFCLYWLQSDRELRIFLRTNVIYPKTTHANYNLPSGSPKKGFLWSFMLGQKCIFKLFFGNILKELYNRAAVVILLFAVYLEWSCLKTSII